MANEFLAVSDGTFTLSETENKNQFYFYRNDGETLTDIDREPIDLYHAYIMNKMMKGEITDAVMNNMYFEMSIDGKCIRLTTYDIGEEPTGNNNSTAHNIGEEPTENNNSTAHDKQPNFLKHLFHKIFG